MPGNITDVNTWTTPIVVPADGDPEGASSVLTSFQGLANRTTNVRSGVQGIASALTMRVPLAPLYNFGGSFSQGIGSTNGWVQTVATSCFMRFSLPHSITGKIDQVTFRVCGGSGAPQHSALPATMPLLTFSYIDLTTVTAAATTVSSVSDSSANVTAYETPHSITTGPGLALAIVANREYLVQISGEASTNSVANAFRVFALEVIYTP